MIWKINGHIKIILNILELDYSLQVVDLGVGEQESGLGWIDRWVELCGIILGKGEQKSGVGWVVGLVGL